MVVNCVSLFCSLWREAKKYNFRNVRIWLSPLNCLLDAKCSTIKFSLQERHDLYTSLYTIKWFLQCFLDRVSSFLF
jgi:hypothetical protein